MKEIEQLQKALIKWKQRTFLTNDEMKKRIESPNQEYPPQVDNLQEVKTVEKHLQLGRLYKEAYELLAKSQYCQMPLSDRQRMIQIEVEIDKCWKDIL